jgi:hypothetical protein
VSAEDNPTDKANVVTRFMLFPVEKASTAEPVARKVPNQRSGIVFALLTIKIRLHERIHFTDSND